MLDQSKYVQLSNICNINNGFAFKSTEFKSIGIPLLRISNINNERVSFDSKSVYVDKAYLSTHRKFIVNKGDVIIALSGATTGKYGVYEFDTPALLNQRIGIIKQDDSTLLNSRYFYFYLSKLKTEILRKAQGAAQPNISTKELGQFKIPLPQLEEQKKIADILDAADSLRQKDKQLVEHYDLLSQSLFLDMFGDPVTNPMGWETKELKNYFDNKPRLGTTTPATPDGTIKLVRVGEIGKKTIDFHKCQFVSLDEKQKERNLLHDGDIILARAIGSIDHLGKASLFKALEYPVVFDSHVMRLRFKQNLLHPIFFYHWMKSHGGRTIFLKNSGKTAVQFNINAQQISRIEIRVPDPEIQNKFVESVNIIEKQKELAQQALKKSDDLFNSLLQRAFKGELTNS